MLTFRPVNILTRSLNPFIFLSFTLLLLSLWYSLLCGLVQIQALESKKAILQTITVRISLAFLKTHAFSPPFSFCFLN